MPLRRVAPPRGAVAAAFGAALLAASVLHAQTLTGALAQAYRANPDLRAQRARLRGAHAQLSEAQAGWRPSVRLSGGAGSEHIDTALAPEIGGTDLKRNLAPRSVSLAVEQSLYDGGKTSASVSRADNTIRAERARLEQTEQNVFVSVAKAYLDVLLTQQVSELEQHNVETLRQQLRATRLREQAGELTPTDVYQAQARLAQARARQRRAQARLAEARASYVRAVGTEPQDLSAPGPLPGLPATRSQALQHARDANPLLSQARYAVAAAHDNTRSVRAASRPSLSLTGEIRHDNDDTIFTKRTDTQRIMLNAEIPLYSGGADDARERRAEDAAAQRTAELDARRKQVTESVTSAWEAWQAATAELDALREQRRASLSALNGVRAEQRAGSRTVLDVLNAQQEYLNAQVSLASARHDQRLAAYRLLAAMGRLTASSLKLSLAVSK